MAIIHSFQPVPLGKTYRLAAPTGVIVTHDMAICYRSGEYTRLFCIDTHNAALLSPGIKAVCFPTEDPPAGVIARLLIKGVMRPNAACNASSWCL